MSLMGAYSRDDYLTRDELRNLPTPQPKGPWHHPVNFGDFVDVVDDELRRGGLVVANEEHYLAGKGDQHFGILTVANGDGVLGGEGWQMMLGIRGSHDMSVSRGLAAGRHVGVCSNGMFYGDMGSVATKQTKRIWDRLRELIRIAVGRLEQAWQSEATAIHQMRDTQLSLPQGDGVLVDIFRNKGMSSVQLGRALEEWVEPTFPDHAEWGRSLWLLEQAVTEALKPTGSRGMSPVLFAERTLRTRPVIEGAYRRLAA